MKILTIVGARPQFVKAAMVSHQLRATPGMVEVLVHTGQHYDEGLSDVFFEELAIPCPHHHLGVGSGSHGRQTGRMLEAIELVLLDERPETVLVYGDTNSTLAGALAAAKLHIPIAHVEAGLRSFNRAMPEEINRVLADHTADLLFAPTDAAVANLRREGISNGRIRQVGDVMYDAVLHFSAMARERSKILDRLGLESKGYVLATVHRAENTDDPERLRAIFDGLALVSRALPIVLPLHPRTRAALRRAGRLDSLLEQVRPIDPVGYLDMLTLTAHACLVATDSGGLQKEAFFCSVPCVTLRDETEWLELVEAGWNRLCPPLEPATVAACLRAALGTTGGQVALYGDGKAAHAIVDILIGQA